MNFRVYNRRITATVDVAMPVAATAMTNPTLLVFSVLPLVAGGRSGGAPLLSISLSDGMDDVR
jgi:hypothetical protein